MEHAIVGGNLEALCAGQTVCMVEMEADVVVLSSGSKGQGRAFANQLMAVGVLQGLQGKALAYRTLRAIMNVVGVAEVAADRYPCVWQAFPVVPSKGGVDGQSSLAIAEGRPRGSRQAAELDDIEGQGMLLVELAPPSLGKELAPRLLKEREEPLVCLDVVGVTLSLVPNDATDGQVSERRNGCFEEVGRLVGMALEGIVCCRLLVEGVGDQSMTPS